MKPYKFFYSKKQLDLKEDFYLEYPDDPLFKIHVNEVFIDGKFVRFTEAMKSGSSNFNDAVFLGAHPEWWVRHNGVIQDKDLASFINNPIN